MAESGLTFDPLSSKAIKIYLFRNGDKFHKVRATANDVLGLAGDRSVLSSTARGAGSLSCIAFAVLRFLCCMLDLTLQGEEMTLNPKNVKTLDQVMDKANKDVKLVTGGACNEHAAQH
jgi:hypothetical protein